MANILSTQNLSPNYFPAQKKTLGQKTQKFFKDCVDAGDQLSGWRSNRTVRTKKAMMKSNYDLMNNKVSPEEMKAVVNPFRIEGFDPTVNYLNYPLINSNLAILIGEEAKRSFRPTVVVLNSDIINENIKKTDAEFMQFMVEKVTANNFDQAETEQELKELERWKNYTYRDKRAVMANDMIEYFMNTLNLKRTFSRGFEDFMIAGEEIYVIDIVAGEPTVRKGNPLNFTVVRSGDTSYQIEDGDIIIEDGYQSIGSVIDDYHEFLSSTDISDIEEGAVRHGGNGRIMFKDQLLNEPINYDEYIEKMYGGIGGLMVHTNTNDSNDYGAYDQDGNIRVLRVLWKGMRKIGFITSFDEEGNEEVRYVDEKYKPNPELGEQVKWMWISEWYEGTRLGDDKYVKMQPREVQFRSMDNPSICHPGIVGTLMNVNSSKAQSFVEFLKPYQLTYNAFMHKLKKAFAKHRGTMPILNSALKPDGWSMDQWMYYAEEVGYAIYDPFNEGTKGAALGKLAGNMNQQQNSIVSDQTSIIQSTLLMLNFLKGQIDEASGVTPQRKGAVENRETVGGVERAVTQSSLNTEKYFSLHDDTKVRVVRALVETAKIAWKGQSFKKGFVLDDMSQGILEYDGDMFLESDYGVYISISPEHQSMFQNLRQLAQAFMQNGGTLSMVANLYNTTDPVSLQRKLEQFEGQLRTDRENERKQALESQQQIAQQAAQLQQEELRIKEEDSIRDDATERYKAELQYASSLSGEGAETPEDTGKLDLENKKHTENLDLKERDLNEKVRSNKAKEKIARQKPAPSKAK